MNKIEQAVTAIAAGTAIGGAAFLGIEVLTSDNHNDVFAQHEYDEGCARALGAQATKAPKLPDGCARATDLFDKKTTQVTFYNAKTGRTERSAGPIEFTVPSRNDFEDRIPALKNPGLEWPQVLEGLGCIALGAGVAAATAGALKRRENLEI